MLSGRGSGGCQSGRQHAKNVKLPEKHMGSPRDDTRTSQQQWYEKSPVQHRAVPKTGTAAASDSPTDAASVCRLACPLQQIENVKSPAKQEGSPWLETPSSQQRSNENTPRLSPPVQPTDPTDHCKSACKLLNCEHKNRPSENLRNTRKTSWNTAEAPARQTPRQLPTPFSEPP